MKFCILILFFFIFQTYFAEIVQISWEATPGSDTGILHYLLDAGYAEQKKYLDAIMEALETNNEKDIIGKKIGLNTTEIVQGFSAWQGKIGAGVQTFVEVSLGSDKDIIPEQKKLLNIYCALLGYLLRQDAVIWYLKDVDKSGNKLEGEEEGDGIEAKFHSILSENDFQMAYNSIHSEFDTWNLAPGFIKEGFNVVNYEQNISMKRFQEGMNKVFLNLKNTEFGGGIKNKANFKSKGEYLANNWTSFSEGEQYLQMVQDQNLWNWAQEIRKFRIDIVNEEFERNTVKSFLRKF